MKFHTVACVVAPVLLALAGAPGHASAQGQIGAPDAFKGIWVPLECYRQTGPSLSVYVVKNNTSATIPAGMTIQWEGSKSNPQEAVVVSTEKLDTSIAPGATKWLTKNPIGAQGPTCTAKFNAGLPDLSVKSTAWMPTGASVEIQNSNPWLNVTTPFTVRAQASACSKQILGAKELTGLTIAKGSTQSFFLPLAKPNGADYVLATVDATNVVLESNEANNVRPSVEISNCSPK